MELTVDQWLAELERVTAESKKSERTGAEGFSSEDFSKAKGVSISRASAIIGKLIDSDVLEFAGNQHRPNRVGGTKVVYVYRVKEQKP